MYIFTLRFEFERSTFVTENIERRILSSTFESERTYYEFGNNDRMDLRNPEKKLSFAV
jgi:hypothetical protein